MEVWHGNVIRITSGSRIKITHILGSQQDQSVGEQSEKGHSWTWHEITHCLSSQQHQSGSENSEKGPSWTWHEITHFLSSHGTAPEWE